MYVSGPLAYYWFMSESRKPVDYSSVQLGTEVYEAKDLQEYDVLKTGWVVIGIEHFETVVRITKRRRDAVETTTWRKTDRIGILDR